MNAAFALPTALQPWQSWLGWFDAELASVLGDLLLRLDPLLGRHHAQASAGHSEPDGLGDLRQRGPYERLLLSEWAIAEAVPEEFLRRAASNEHLFLAPRLTQPQAQTPVVAIFDAGPAQLGAARLVHVAMWVLLARRAQALRVRFVWGVAQAPGVLHDSNDPALLKKLLRARTLELASDAHWQQWQQHLDGDSTLTNGTPAGERWLLGAPDVGVPRGFSHLVMTRRSIAHSLRVELGTRQARRKLELALPLRQHAERLLSGEFIARVDTRRRRTIDGQVSVRQPPLFSHDGDCVVVLLLGERRAALLPIDAPEQRKQTNLRYSQWASQADLLCGVVVDRDFRGLIADAHHLYFWKLPGFGTQPRPEPDMLKIVPGASRWPPCFLLKGGKAAQRVVALDGDGRLVSWSGGPRTSQKAASGAVIDTDVIGVAQADAQQLLYARWQADSVRLRRLRADGSVEDIVRLLASPRPTAVMFRGRFVGGRWRGMVCCEYRNGTTSRCRLQAFNLREELEDADLTLPTGSRLLGLVADPQHRDESAVLVLRGDRRALVAITAGGSEVVHQAARDIMAASVSAQGDKVACIDLDGRVVVLGDGGRNVLMDVRGRQGSPPDA